MTSLLEIRQMLRVFYIRYELYIGYVLKFSLALICLITVNTGLGYRRDISGAFAVILVSLLCAVLPVGFTVFACALFILLHLLELSIECFGICLILFILMYLMYYRFQPHDTVVLLLTPVLFGLGIPYVMPLVAGLLSTPVSILSMACGVVVFCFLKNVTSMEASFTNLGDTEESAAQIIARVQSILDALVKDRGMIVYVVAFAVTLLTVYIIRRLSVAHSWTIATVTGAFVDLMFLLVGDLMFDTDLNIVGLILGTMLGIFVCVVVGFFVFSLDYERTERVQFQDDEYYYYVKAVPKIALTERQSTVKNINRVQEKNRDRSKPGKAPAASIKSSGHSNRGESGGMTLQREKSMRVSGASGSYKKTAYSRERNGR